MNSVTYDPITRSHATPMDRATFKVGDIVEIDDELGVTYIIRAIDYGFAWLFSPVEGFETAEFSELKRLDPSHQRLG